MATDNGRPRTFATVQPGVGETTASIVDEVLFAGLGSASGLVICPESANMPVEEARTTTLTTFGTLFRVELID